MEIEQVKNRAGKLEVELSNSIKEFEKETGTLITDIYINRIKIMEKRNPIVTDTKFKINLW